MDLNKRMNDFRLASRELYNQYFFSQNKEQACEAEERHSILLEYLFQYMVLQPENIEGFQYFEESNHLIASFKPKTCGYYLFQVEKKPGDWVFEKVSCALGSPQMYFECYFDWDDIGIKDNLYAKGILLSCVGAEHLIGNECLFEASYTVYHKA